MAAERHVAARHQRQLQSLFRIERWQSTPDEASKTLLDQFYQAPSDF